MSAAPIDLRSDTVTLPTQAMREAMFSCEVGDDVLGEDPTINRLERSFANLLGKEAALFVPSGTFANQCAVMTHTESGNEIILSEDCHILQHEAGASALLSRVQLRTVSPANGSHLTAKEILPRIRIGDDIHYPRTSLICIEQATAWGSLYPIDEMKAIAELAKTHDLRVHIDGARLFNAASALNVEARELAAYGDSVSVCLSKGLCAPVGSLLAGTAEFIAQARRNRKIMGGGMRQAGFLAAAGEIALDQMRLRLEDDHLHARLLAEAIQALPGLTLTRPCQINMVFFKNETGRIDDAQALQALYEKGIWTYPPEGGEFRLVTHHGVERDDIERAVQAIQTIFA